MCKTFNLRNARYAHLLKQKIFVDDLTSANFLRGNLDDTKYTRFIHQH